MDTQWDDDRIRETVKERASKSAITGLDEVGWIVQIHDHGPADGRSTKPVLLFDSESTHGSAGIFHDEDTAQEFADRRRAAELRCQREIEAERHRRKDSLSERQREQWAEEKRQKEIAKAANKAAKAADDLARALAEEAESPNIAIQCSPSEDGWSLWVAPCWTDGTQENGDPRQLVIEGSGMLGPRKLADSKTPVRRGYAASGLPADEDDRPAKPKRQGKDPAAAKAYYENEADKAGPAHPNDQPRRLPPKRKTKPAAPAPEHVADSGGLPIAIGSRVTFLVADTEGVLQETEGRITQIKDMDRSGVHMVEIEDGNGVPYDALATECTRVPADDEPSSEDWPDPEAA